MSFKYSTITSIFLQDEPDTDPTTFDFINSSFGIEKATGDASSTPAWTRLKDKVQRLNRESGGDVFYKLLFLGRHGEGFHNVAEWRYGTEAWEAKWAKLDGDEHGPWVDALLTKKGAGQALNNSAGWKKLIEEGGVVPTSFYSSPLRRCLQTGDKTFWGLHLPGYKTVVIKEKLREVNGVHTCDKRSSKEAIVEFIKQEFQPGLFVFEEGFPDVDETWTTDHRETDDEIDVRLKGLLDDVFAHDDSEVISLTSHSGSIASILRVIGHRGFALQTGGVIPVMVKAEKTK